MIQLTFKQMADAPKKKIEFVPCPEFAPADIPAEKRAEYGVFVMSLTLQERDEWEKSLALEAQRQKSKSGINDYRARFVARVICDETGARAAGDTHWELFRTFASAPMSRICDVAMRLSGMTDNDLEAAVEVLKNGQVGEPGTA